MIYLTQLIYVKEGQEEKFHAFEEHAIPVINKYKGNLLFRIRTDASSWIEGSMEQPYEIHLISFPSTNDFERFKRDEERKQWMHLKEQSIRESWLIQGHRL